MDRRDFLKSTSAAALAAGTATVAAARAAKAADDAQALAAPAVVPQRRELRMVSLWPDAVTGPGDHVRRLAKRIEAATDQRWVIEIADAPAVGADAFKAVMTGEADLYVGHEHAHRELNPAFSYFAGLPCRTGMHIDGLNAWLVAAGGQELWDELAGEFNMKGLLIGHSGTAKGLYTREPIRVRGDFKGKRIAAEGFAADVLRAVDATAATGLECVWQCHDTVPSLDGVDALRVASPTPQSGDWRLSALDKPYCTNVPINDSGCAFTLGLRRSLWDGFSNSERIVLTALASEAFNADQAEVRAAAVASMQIAGLFVFSPSARARSRAETASHPAARISKQLIRIAETIVADVAGHDEHSRRINASYMAFKGPRPTGVIA